MNVPLHSRSTQAAEGLPRRRFTVAEVEAMVEAGIMDEDERVELIGGSWFRCRRRGISTKSSRRPCSIAGIVGRPKDAS